LSPEIVLFQNIYIYIYSDKCLKFKSLFVLVPRIKMQRLLHSLNAQIFDLSKTFSDGVSVTKAQNLFLEGSRTVPLIHDQWGMSVVRNNIFLAILDTARLTWVFVQIFFLQKQREREREVVWNYNESYLSVK